MGKKKKHHEEHFDESWLLPYSDMLVLLLALFIVMFAMGQTDKEKFKQLSQQLNVVFAGGSGMLQESGNNISIIDASSAAEKEGGALEQDKMTEIKQKLEQEINDKGYQDKVNVQLNGDGLEISIQDTVLFNSGGAEVLQGFSPILVNVSYMLHGLDNDIRIAGHTDNVPISNQKFKSNWDLSYARAANVMNFMVGVGGLANERFSIQAYGEYKPKFDNSTEEGRAKNRTVQILIVRKYPLDTKKNN
jgi:chemotaxis protein MotB